MGTLKWAVSLCVYVCVCVCVFVCVCMCVFILPYAYDIPNLSFNVEVDELPTT